MKITLEFDSPKEYFEQLPRFAALMNFSGQFADFKAKPEGEADTQIEDPDLPRIERTPDKLTVHAGSVKNKTKEEVGDLINKAYDTAEAIGATAQPEQEKTKPEQPEPPKQEKGKPEPPKQDEAPKADKPKVKDADVRKALSELIKSGKRDKVKEILVAYGAEIFTDLKPKFYDEVLKKAEEALKNG